MAKKSFDISSTLKKNKETQLAPKVDLKKKNKNLEEIEKKVALIHKEEVPDPVEKAPQATVKAKTTKAASTPGKLVRLTIDTPEAMHRKLKIQSIERGISMRDYILQLLERELK